LKLLLRGLNRLVNTGPLHGEDVAIELRLPHEQLFTCG
jgi:hypothetical protein